MPFPLSASLRFLSDPPTQGVLKFLYSATLKPDPLLSMARLEMPCCYSAQAKVHHCVGSRALLTSSSQMEVNYLNSNFFCSFIVRYLKFINLFSEYNLSNVF